MALEILHKGIQMNLDLDTSGFTYNDVEGNAATAYIQGLIAGRAVGIDSDGLVQLTGEDSSLDFLGFLINDADGYFYENKPALGSGKVAVTLGNCLIVTDQWTPAALAKPIAPGDVVFCDDGTGINGLLTVGTTGDPMTLRVGVALTAGSVASPNVTVAVGV